MSRRLTPAAREQQNALRRQAWNKQSAAYDRQIGWFERRVFGTEHRPWACRHAHGDVLEVAIGTGLNVPLYDTSVRLTGIDLSPAMLDIAQKRAADIGREIDLREADAQELPFADDSFDTVVCTFSLCNIPDIHCAIDEMKRVLRSGGNLVLVDHVRSTFLLVLWIQKAIEVISVRIDGDRMTRRPLDQVYEHGFAVDVAERFKLGLIERVLATKP